MVKREVRANGLGLLFFEIFLSSFLGKLSKLRVFPRSLLRNGRKWVLKIITVR